MSDNVSAHAMHRGVAVILPARNEVATVGDIVSSVRCHQRDGLVDEVIVVDSASTDDTAAVAARSGARVVTAASPGKGEAMWHGVAATNAELIVFLDADLERFDSRFVPSLLGPLLADPSISLVKGAYERRTDTDVTVGGGRVTELVARPLLAMFWPELASIVQPLGGEYAARRALLEQLPFRCGYGVDIGLLLDTCELLGAAAIGQVDLHERFHSHSDLQALGRMAAEVLHTVADRLISQGRLAADAVTSTALSQPVRASHGFGFDRHDVDVSERPPLREWRASGLEEVRTHRLDHPAHPVAPVHACVADELVHPVEVDPAARQRVLVDGELRSQPGQLAEILRPLLDADSLVAGPVDDGGRYARDLEQAGNRRDDVVGVDRLEDVGSDLRELRSLVRPP